LTPLRHNHSFQGEAGTFQTAKDTSAFEAITPHQQIILSLCARKSLFEAIASKQLVVMVRKRASVQTEQRPSQIGSRPEIIYVPRHKATSHRPRLHSIGAGVTFPTFETTARVFPKGPGDGPASLLG